MSCSAFMPSTASCPRSRQRHRAPGERQRLNASDRAAPTGDPAARPAPGIPRSSVCSPQFALRVGPVRAARTRVAPRGQRGAEHGAAVRSSFESTGSVPARSIALATGAPAPSPAQRRSARPENKHTTLPNLQAAARAGKIAPADQRLKRLGRSGMALAILSLTRTPHHPCA